MLSWPAAEGCSCGTGAAELGEAGRLQRSPELEAVPRGVSARHTNRAAGGFTRCCGTFLLLVNKTEICCFHKDLLPRALVIHSEPPSYAWDFFCGRRVQE